METAPCSASIFDPSLLARLLHARWVESWDIVSEFCGQWKTERYFCNIAWYVKRSVTKIDIKVSGDWASVKLSLHQLQTWRASSRGHCAARWCAARRPRRARRPACSSCSSTPAPPAAAPCRYLTGSRISQQPPWVYCHIFNMLIYFPKIFAICYKKIFTVLLIL